MSKSRPSWWSLPGRLRVLPPGVIAAVAVLSALYAILLPSAALAQDGVSKTVLDNVFLSFEWNDGALGRVMRPFAEGQHRWAGAAVGAAGPIYLALACMELAISGYGWTMRSEAPDVILRELTKKVLLLGTGGALMQYYSKLVWPLAEGLARAGGYITTGKPTVADPGDVFVRGVGLSFKVMFGIFRPTESQPNPAVPGESGNVFQQAADAAIGTLGMLRQLRWYFATGPLFLLAAVMVLVCGLSVFTAFLLITLQLVRSTVEMALMLGVGVFLLGFSGSRVTAGITEGYLSYAVETGMRFFMLNALVGVGIQMTTTWQVALGDAFFEAPSEVGVLWWLMPNFSVIMEVMLGSLLFAYLVWTIPNKFAGVATKNLNFGLQQALSS